MHQKQPPAKVAVAVWVLALAVTATEIRMIRKGSIFSAVDVIFGSFIRLHSKFTADFSKKDRGG
jgi:hypothetical protein